MLGSLTDTLILVFIAILLLGGEGDLSGTFRKVGKWWGELKRSEEEFRKEITKELGDIDVNYSFTDNSNSGRSFKGYTSNQDIRVQELERQVRELQEEVKRLKKENGEN
ncbi:MAG: twin-arginine translocase TatA/TatE family subunit [Nitrososphaeria archaeon]